MSWDWEKDRDEVAVGLRRHLDPLVGPLELADQMRLDASVSMVIEYFSRTIYGRGTGTPLGFLGLDVESSDHGVTP